VSAIIGVAVFVLLVGWYLLGKENVVEYYRALGREESARAGAVSKGGAYHALEAGGLAARTLRAIR